MSKTSVREYAVLYLGGKAIGSSAMGGTVALGAGVHAHDGPEHSGLLPLQRISTTELDITKVAQPDGLGGIVFDTVSFGDLVPWSYAKEDGGLVGDGVTDDTAAMQAWITSVTASGTRSGWFFFEPGTYLIAGALQSSGTYYGQIILPGVSFANPQITLTFKGAARPPMAAHGSMPAPGGYAIIKSTLTGATANASCISGQSVQNNISVVIEDLLCITPDNPTFTFWDLGFTQGGSVSGLMIATNAWTGSVVQPTHSNQYGIVLPGANQSNYTQVDGLMVVGQYSGIALGELTIARGLIFGFDQIAVVVPGAPHASLIVSMQASYCTYGIDVTGGHYLDILQYDSEHDSGGHWYSPIADLYDPSNLMYGHIRWVGVLGGSGPDHQFLVTGGANVSHVEVGPISAPAGFATPSIALGASAAAGAAATVIRSDATIAAFDATAPVTQALGDSAATGSAAFAAHRDHKHGMPALSTATPLIESGAGATGTGTLSSREDHVHPASTGGGGELLISDTPSTPLVFADILQNDAQTDFLYSG